MKPSHIILIRHGQSEGNVDRRVYEHTPDHLIKLTERGLDQARTAGGQLADFLKHSPVQFYVSPYLRSRQTLEGILQSFRPERHRIYEEPRIREQEWGLLPNLEIRREHMEARARYGAFYYRMPNGESGADVYDRVSTFLETLHRAFEKPAFPENAVIVTHGITMRLFLMRWYHWTHERFEALPEVDNCRFVAMRRGDDQKYRLLDPLPRLSYMISFPDLPDSP